MRELNPREAFVWVLKDTCLTDEEVTEIADVLFDGLTIAERCHALEGHLDGICVEQEDTPLPSAPMPNLS